MKATSDSEQFTKTEQEVIVLKALWELIDDMVNFAIFAKVTETVDIALSFNSSTHQRLFNVLLVDFLSPPATRPFGLPPMPREGAETNRTLLFQLKFVVGAPQLNVRGGRFLAEPLNAFVEWLETECLVKDVWLPSISLKIDLRLRRITFLKICGNIAKHGFTRLGVNVGDIRRLLEANGATVDREEAYLVIPEFFEWFHTNLLSYHSSAIAEFLNNIRWGIYDYLKPEFARSFTRDDPSSIAYRFLYPTHCDRPVARAMYWDLMNAVRSEPYVPRFQVSRYMKMRY